MKNITISFFAGIFLLGCAGTMPTTPAKKIDSNQTIEVKENNISSKIENISNEVNATKTKITEFVINESKEVTKVKKDIKEEKNQIEKKYSGTKTKSKNFMNRVKRIGKLQPAIDEVIKVK